MASQIKLLDTIALTADLPALGLTAGEVGEAVEVLGHGEAFIVEFCDNAGVTYGLHTLKADQIASLHGRGEALWLRVEAD